ncbi:MAG: hypothetical protein J6X69_06500 [Bacteroidales bacterium]|nr:hypothetical protein [Bacteroidales bacterium]
MISSRPNNRFFSLFPLIAGLILPVCIIFVLASALSSCDFLRRMAGRPTSSELALLEQKRDSLEIERRLKHKRPAPEATETSPSAAEPVSDEAQIQALRDASGSLYLRRLSRFRGSAPAAELFYVIVGTFKEADNAERFCKRLQDAFPQAQVLVLGNGLRLTAVCATDRADQTLSFLAENKARLPAETWVLINDLR